MATRADTTTGTITTVAGSPAFTCSGVNLVTRGHLPGDTIYNPASGLTLVIETITGENSGTLRYPCPSDANGTNNADIRFQSDGSRVTAQARNLIDVLGGGNLASLAGLDGTGGNKGLYLSSPGVISEYNLTAWGRGLLNNPDVANGRIYLGLLELATRSSTAYARGILDNPDAANTRTYLGAQVASAQLDALSGVASTAYGRSLLTTTSAAALLSSIGGLSSAGGTLTGNLVMSSTDPAIILNKANGGSSSIVSTTAGSSRWRLDMGDAAGEGGGNAGSNLYLRRYGDDGSQLSIPLAIDRASGAVDLGTSKVSINSTGTAELSLDKTGTTSCLIVSRKSGTKRWQMDFGDGEAEGGGNSGSNYYLRNYSDAGSPLGLVMSINRATGNVSFGGSISKASGTFLIDHPLDPDNKQLAHGFVEAPEYQNRYRGLAKLTNGKATINIDAVSGMTEGTFAALNTDAWVASLLNQEGFARLRPGKFSGNTFEILCEDPLCEDLVAWEVTARRNDTFVREKDDNCDSEGRFITERDKQKREED